jgi:hypothetical protein
MDPKKSILLFIAITVGLGFTMQFAAEEKWSYLGFEIMGQICSGYFQVAFISLPAKMFGIKLGSYYSTLVIFVLTLSVVSQGVIVYFLLEALGYAWLYTIFGIISAVTFLIATQLEVQ